MQKRLSPIESERELALRSIGLSFDSDEGGYDDAIQIAVALFSTPIAYVTLFDDQRQWLAAKVGIRAIGEETGSVFNEYVVATGTRLVVEDAQVDARFSNDQCVCGPMHLRFFAGVPLYVNEAIAGTLCVVDTIPRIADSRKLLALAALGRQVSDILKQRSTAASLVLKEHEMAGNMEEAHTSSTLHRFAARRFETLFHGVPIACFTFDERSTVQEWNREAERVFGLPAFDVLDESMYRALGLGRRTKTAVNSIQCVLSGETVEDVEWAYRRPDGSTRRLLTSAFPLRGAQGQIVGGVCATIDITERKVQERALRRANSELGAANARLARLALHDGLTGIPNYRAFQERLEVEFANSRRHNQPMCLVLIDVDRFKSVNDTYGHPAGDKILRILANVLLQASRIGDFVARYGGEEFVMLLPNTTTELAGHIAERIRKAVADFDWPYASVTISVGYANTDETPVPTPQELITRADRALYQSKNDGRDRVTCSKEAA
jgi:diguanylate cyclase (GGDEF)-like protein/PAS domain S-box-containing protein